MKEQLAALWAKVVENKEVVIRVGLTAAGVAVGAALVTVISNMQVDDYSILEEVDAIDPMTEIEEN